MRWTEQPIHFIDFEGSLGSGVLEYGVATLVGGAARGVQARERRRVRAVAHEADGRDARRERGERGVKRRPHAEGEADDQERPPDLRFNYGPAAVADAPAQHSCQSSSDEISNEQVNSHGLRGKGRSRTQSS